MGVVGKMLKLVYDVQGVELHFIKKDALKNKSEKERELFKQGLKRVKPFSNYAPWDSDLAFQELYQTIKDHTLVDIFRSYELWTLAAQYATKVEGDFLEVGVWRGGTSAILAKQLVLNAVKKKLYLADTFTGVVKAGDNDSTYSGGEHADTSVELVEDLLQRVAPQNYEILQGIFPEDTAHKIADKKFAICHIDVDVYQSAKDVLDWVWPRLSVGGVVVYDDYGFINCDGIIKLVNEQRRRTDCVVLHNLNGHAIQVKLG
jgi:O-methyltransferase